MLRQVEKKAFLFYASTLDIIEELPKKRQGKVAIALIEYGLDDFNYFADFSGSLSILDSLERIIFRSVIYEISVQKRRYYNKYLIRGAILSLQTEIAKEDKSTGLNVLSDKERAAYIDLINILEERYRYVTKHDERNMPSELKILLPASVYDIFEQIYEPNSWRDYLKQIFENRLENESKNLPDNAKENIFEELKEDYLKTGVALERYDELLEQYTEDLEGSDYNET